MRGSERSLAGQTDERVDACEAFSERAKCVANWASSLRSAPSVTPTPAEALRGVTPGGGACRRSAGSRCCPPAGAACCWTLRTMV